MVVILPFVISIILTLAASSSAIVAINCCSGGNFPLWNFHYFDTGRFVLRDVFEGEVSVLCFGNEDAAAVLPKSVCAI